MGFGGDGKRDRGFGYQIKEVSDCVAFEINTNTRRGRPLPGGWVAVGPSKQALSALG